MKQAIIINNGLGMGKGKIAAQASHASVESFLEAQRMKPAWVREWLEEGQKKIVLKLGNARELGTLSRKAGKLPRALIRDAGLTQIEKGSVTALAIGPAPDPEIDKLVSELKLL